MAEFNTDRKFVTGADRSSDTGKPHPERAWSPLVIRRFAEYMRDHNIPGGRREDQWQLGFPFESFVDSGWRHFEAWWEIHRGLEATDEKGNAVDIEEALCGLIFNANGYLHQLLLAKLPEEQRTAYLAHVRKANPQR